MAEKLAEPASPPPRSGHDVFLSHNGADKPAVLEIALRLRKVGIEPFFDKWHLVPGEAWQEALEQALDESRSCAVFLGPQGFGPWENVEMRAALSRRVSNAEYRVIPVLLPGAALPERGRLPRFLAQVTWVDFRPGLDDADAFDRLVAGIRGLAPETGANEPVSADLDEIPCPFRGLEVFDEAHAEYFFGREALTQHLVEQLRDDRFLAVLGPSGSGKSSVVRAGLIPQLRRGALPGSNAWDVVLVRPGTNPMEALATRLVGLVGPGGDALGTRASILDTLNRDERGLHTIVQLAVDAGSADDRVVIVVDQFEEIFTLVEEDAGRSKFVAALLYASSVTGGPTVVVTTMRADFFGKCASIPGLAARLSERDVLVAPMVPDEVRQAMILPAEKVGLQFEKGLVDTILEDIGTEPGSLPLLQHTLLELFEGRRGRWLTIDHYRAIGGVKGAIAKRAETIYETLTPAQQAAARRILLRLTQPGEGTEDTRRRASMMELVPAGGGGESVEAVVNELAEARLLTTSREESGEETVDVAHEALIRGWPRLHSWVAENPVALRIHRDLSRAAEAWADNKRDRSFLFTGPRLDETAAFAARNPDDLNELERSFVTASRRVRQARTFGLVAAAVAISVVFAGLGFIAFARGEEATRAAEEATRAAEMAKTNAMHSSSLAEAREAPALGLRIGLEALIRGEELGMNLDQLKRSVSTMLDSGRYAYLPAPIHLAWTDPGGRVLIGALEHGPAVIFDTRTGAKLTELINSPVEVVFPGAPDAGVFALAYADGSYELRRIADGLLLETPPGMLGAAIDSGAGSSTLVAFYGPPDITADDPAPSAPAEIRSVVDGSLVRVLDGPGTPVLLAPGPDRLATVSFEDGGVEVIRLADGSSSDRIETDGLAEVEPNPVGQSFVIPSGDRCTLWSLEPRRSTPLDDCAGVVFSHDGRRLAITNGAAVRILDVDSQQVLAEIDGDWALIASTPDAVVLSSEDRTLIYSTRHDRELVAFPEPISITDDEEPSARISPDGSLIYLEMPATRVLVSAATGKVVLTGEMLTDGDVVFTDGLDAVEFSSDGEWFWVSTTDGGPEIRRTDAPETSLGFGTSGEFWPGSDGALLVGPDGLERIEGLTPTLLFGELGIGMSILGFEPGDQPEAAIVTYGANPEEAQSASILARDGTVSPLGGSPDEAQFSTDRSNGFVLLQDLAARVALWDRTGEPRQLATFDVLSLATWDPAGRWLQVSTAANDAYLLDLEWLRAINSPDRSGSVEWLEQRVCDGPARRLVDDATLQARLGEVPRSCRES